MKQRILIVDDNATNVAVLQELLDGDYELEIAYSGPECLDKLHEFGPDLVLLDIMMDGMDGYEVCRYIKEQPHGELTQVILVSAHSSTEARLKGYEAGADDYLAKPFDHDEILAKVHTHFRLLGTLRELAATRAELTLHNEKLNVIVEQRTRQILTTRDVTVFALAKLAESRDPETGEHLERMRNYARILAEDLSQNSPYANDINEDFIDNIYQSSPLHDIGKVGIPDVILLKPGQLSSSEFEIMKRHTTIGADALESCTEFAESGSFLRMGADIARYHHERYNGTGYPNGLQGQAIPLAARIVALADVFDALTSVRVYKSAFEPEVAHSMIVEQSGKHFDPTIVQAFCNRWCDFLKIGKFEGKTDAVPVPSIN